jgi:1-acyl-sn-glycerol-3-phosphate acyltransferase
MEDWKFEPAHDLALSGMERYRSPRREGGLVESGVRLVWWGLLRTTFRLWNRLQITGREHLPQKPPFVLIANHASHLDALLLSTVLPLYLRDQTFPIAAQDVFFEKHALAAFAATVLNAIPIYRRATSGQGLAGLRERLLNGPSVFLLFPEGKRSRTGAMDRFKPGLGMLIAGTDVPVVPCYITGAFAAMPPNRWLLRPSRMTIHIGPPQTFGQLPAGRAGWEECARSLEQAVAALKPGEPD